jgi:hypothetical protein
VPDVRDLINEVKAAVQGQRPVTKGASSGGSVLDSFTPLQFDALANRLEKVGQVQEATGRILEIRKEAQVRPEATQAEIRKLAYRQALRELGFSEGNRISPLSVLFGDMDKAQEKLAQLAANAASQLIAQAVQIGLGEEGEAQ